MYDTPVGRMTEMRDSLREIATGRPELIRADKVDIHIHDLSRGSVNLLVNVYFWADTYSEELEARDWLNREILALADRLEIELDDQGQLIRMVDLPTRPAPPDTPHSRTGGVPAPKFLRLNRDRNRTDA